jgi:hypothetical protein
MKDISTALGSDVDVQMFVPLAEGTLKDFMEFGETGCAVADTS